MCDYATGCIRPSEQADARLASLFKQQPQVSTEADAWGPQQAFIAAGERGTERSATDAPAAGFAFKFEFGQGNG